MLTAAAIFAPGVPELMAEFRSSSQELAAFVVSVYVLGVSLPAASPTGPRPTLLMDPAADLSLPQFAFGPMLLAPLSEIYGRSIIYHICNVGFSCFVVGCALAPSLNALIAFRFLSGIFGS